MNKEYVSKQAHLEDELLLCCVRTYTDAQIVEEINVLIGKELDWTYLLQTSALHGTTQLLYRNLKTACPEAVPKEIIDWLREDFQLNAQRNLFQTSELLKLLKLFEINNIRVIPFKGPMLAASAYGNIAMRRFSDLDILVQEQDIQKAKNLLVSQGYKQYSDLNWEYHFFHEDKKVSVDMHEAIAPKYLSFPINFDRLWSRLKPISVAGMTVPSLAPEDLLLILCVQWAKDCCEGKQRLAQLCDVAHLLHAHPQLSWCEVLKQARTLGVERMLLLDLFLVCEMLGVALPEAVVNKLQCDFVVKSLAAQISSKLWRTPENSDRECEFDNFWCLFRAYDHRLHLSMRERLQDKITYCISWSRQCLKIALTPNEKDLALLPLPKAFSFLYHPLHLVRLAKKYLLDLSRHSPKL